MGLDGFTDMLEEVRKQGDLMWITQQKNFVENIYKQQRTPEQIKQAVLNSERLKHVKNKLENEKKATKEQLDVESKKILDEMAHNFDLKIVRFLGYVLIKVFKRIYKNIYYNSDLSAKINEISKRYPIIYLPNHRSYMDFQLVSLVCFHTGIKLPSVAAGEDFLGLSHVSKLLRGSGAFFIRRSFGSDELYWALFHEYVQQHLVNCDSPLEFFLEGMRSRTSKYLSPKQGMLATCLECVFKNQVSDIYIVPVSITYERLLEETLYARELLGIPKPKENVSGLLKAHTILKECYGSIIVNFSNPLSVREMIARQGLNLNRQIHNLTPFFIFELDKLELKSIEFLSYTILGEISRKQIIQPISLIASCMLLAQNKFYRLNLKELYEQMIYLKQILANIGYKFYWPVSFSENFQVKSFLLSFLKVHSSNLFYFTRYNTLKETYEAYNADISSEETTLIYANLKLNQESSLFDKASTYLALSIYRNTIINYFVSLGLVAVSLVAVSVSDKIVVSKGSIFKYYTFLTSLFNREFIFHPAEILQTFEKTLVYFKIMKLCEYNEETNEIRLVKHNYKQVKLFISLIKSFISNYSIVYQLILTHKLSRFENEKIFYKKLQEHAFDEITRVEKSGHLKIFGFEYSYELLSLNLIMNSVLVLKSFKILNKNQNAYEIDLEKLNGLYLQICDLIVNLEQNKNTFDDLFEIKDDDANHQFPPSLTSVEMLTIVADVNQKANQDDKIKAKL